MFIIMHTAIMWDTFFFVSLWFLNLKIVSKLNIVRFAPKNGEGFYDTLKKNIDTFFTENKVSMSGNRSLYLKTVAMLALFFVPMTLIIVGVGASSAWIFFGLWFLTGLGMVGLLGARRRRRG